MDSAVPRSLFDWCLCCKVQRRVKEYEPYCGRLCATMVGCTRMNTVLTALRLRHTKRRSATIRNQREPLHVVARWYDDNQCMCSICSQKQPNDYSGDMMCCGKRMALWECAVIAAGSLEDATVHSDCAVLWIGSEDDCIKLAGRVSDCFTSVYKYVMTTQPTNP